MNLLGVEMFNAYFINYRCFLKFVGNVYEHSKYNENYKVEGKPIHSNNKLRTCWNF